MLEILPQHFVEHAVPVLVILAGGLIIIQTRPGHSLRPYGAALFTLGLVAYVGVTLALG